MFGFHWLELLVLLPLVALLLGPKRLPAVGEGLGRALGGFRRGLAELKEETGIEEMRRDLKTGLSQLKDESGLDEVRRELGSLDRPPR
jgi:sec-independent protein translocase protein TatA